MRLEFKIDPHYDFKMTVHMLRGKDWEYRAKSMGLSKDLVKRINSCVGRELKEAEKKLEDIVANIFKDFSVDIERAKSGYQKSWDLVIDEFSNTVADISVPWFYDKYIVNITNFNRGISNWDGNIIGRWWREDFDKQRRITAHEILLAHFYTIHRRLYEDSGLDREQIWALSEIFAFALTGLEPRINKFWLWDTKGYYTNHNYPQIVDLQNALKEPYLSRKNFNEYILKGIILAKKLFPVSKH
ncbi:MAG: hypothetical protein ABIA11_04165 [Patescibacteria group bacterium]|nr:hypothetical protein [Patescibacteria group bacterium]